MGDYNGTAKNISNLKEDAVKHLVSSMAAVAIMLAISSSAVAQTRITLLLPDPLKREVDKIVQDFQMKTHINVQESYGTGVGTRRTVHDGLSFRAEAGERLGLVGPSGGGKSSIVRLLLRFYDPDEGAIRLGGHDLRQLSFAQIRSLIAVVLGESPATHWQDAFGDAAGLLDFGFESSGTSAT